MRLDVGRITHPIEILSRVTALISFSGSSVEPTLVLICKFKIMLHASVVEHLIQQLSGAFDFLYMLMVSNPHVSCVGF